ncbi:MAG: DUF86 domain-containing protein [Bacteroidales bacterium]|nr:DUF86 domain-containing protein [Bacteroidales bacterium]
MNHEIKAWLEDIKRSIDEIHEFLPKKRDFFQFNKDLKTQKAVERNLEIIGEALNRILKVEPDIKITDSRKIVDTRNRIIHGYNSVTSDILWLIISKSLPKLQEDIANLMK